MDYKTLVYPNEAPAIKYNKILLKRLFVHSDFQKDVFLKFNLVDLKSEVFCL